MLRPVAPPDASAVRFGELLGALSYALDLTEGQPPGHCVRCCWIGMQMAPALGLTPQQQTDLYLTLLMKDLGCSSNAARICQLYLADDLTFKKEFKTLKASVPDAFQFVLRNTAAQAGPFMRLKTIANVLNNSDDIAKELMQTRCDRGAEIARLMRFSEGVAEGIAGLDEHWDGGGRPLGTRGGDIPLYSRIALMAQVTDVFTMELGAYAAASELSRRAGSWFDPALVAVLLPIVTAPDFEAALSAPSVEAEVFAADAANHTLQVDEDYLDEVSHAFARVIDAKSPFTHGHSERVAHYTGIICTQLGYTPAHRRWMVRTALLHDIGKLGVSNAILDKPDKLTDEEFDKIKLHPVMGHEILSRIPVFAELAEVALAHHERLDGNGYPNGWNADRLSRDMRILTVADIFDALTADRPYRAAMPLEKAYDIMNGLVGRAIDGTCYDALRAGIQPAQFKTAVAANNPGPIG